MSVGHAIDAKPKPSAELYEILGEGDTPKLYARPVNLITDKDIPYAGGNSVNGKNVYIDRRFYEDIKSGRVVVRGMTFDQIVSAIIEHEHTEWAVDVGDNGVDVYQPAHEFAEAKENAFVKDLGVNLDRYNVGLEAAIKACLRRKPENPPKDLWCGPVLDHPDVHDKEILRILQSKGVEDAFKASKFDVHYSISPNRCKDCRFMEFPDKPFSRCEKVSGLVRQTRGCDLFDERK